MKLSSDDLLDRLKKKGTRDPAYTKGLIIDKLNDNDADVATTSLKVTVSCPLGKMRMRVSICVLLHILVLIDCSWVFHYISLGTLSTSNLFAFAMF